MTLVPGAAAIDLWNGSVDLRSCTLTSGAGPALINGATVRADNTTTVGAVPSPAGVTISAASLPWTTGASAAPGGVMQVNLDGPPATLAVTFASLGMLPPIASPFGDIWVDQPSEVALIVGVTDANGQLGGTISVPATVQRGLQVTCQTLLLGTNGLATTTPAILQVL